MLKIKTLNYTQETHLIGYNKGKRPKSSKRNAERILSNDHKVWYSSKDDPIGVEILLWLQLFIRRTKIFLVKMTENKHYQASFSSDEIKASFPRLLLPMKVLTISRVIFNRNDFIVEGSLFHVGKRFKK